MDDALQTAYNNYLSDERNNVIIVSLAAPENFILGEDDLRASISKQLLQLEVDTYLKITVTGLDKVEEAKQKAIPLNALLLGELWTNSTLGACVLQK